MSDVTEAELAKLRQVERQQYVAAGRFVALMRALAGLPPETCGACGSTGAYRHETTGVRICAGCYAALSETPQAAE